MSVIRCGLSGEGARGPCAGQRSTGTGWSRWSSRAGMRSLLLRCGAIRMTGECDRSERVPKSQTAWVSSAGQSGGACGDVDNSFSSSVPAGRLGRCLTNLVKRAQAGGVGTQVNIYEAKTQLSKLVERAAAGEEIVIARGGRPMARLVPLQPSSGPRLPGPYRGEFWIAPDFDALPDDV